MSGSPEAYPTAAFAYELPPGRIAQYPHQRRDESRLLLLERASGAIQHLIFRDLAERIPAGDALVLNETRVFPARLVGRKHTGGEVEILLLRPRPDTGMGGHGDAGTLHSPRPRVPVSPRPAVPASPRPRVPASGGGEVWEALVRPGRRVRPGTVVTVGEELAVEVTAELPGGGRLVRLDTTLPLEDALARYGKVPLPPYIEREPEPVDSERYQTVYARAQGSVAAPTAGLHFTPELLAMLEDQGVRLVRLVLHVGVGTFRPVEAEDPAQHRMHAEHYAVPAAAAAALNETRARGGAIWAVGTTVARTLETVTRDDGVVCDGNGWTDLFIRPPYRFKAVDRLITNFHLPRSTLLMLVAAFGGYQHVMRAYREAIERGYRFYSYGDAMAIV